MAIVWLVCLYPVFGQVPSMRRFSLKEGMPQSEIPALFQDSRGLIWMATRGGGLVQFDGYQLQTIKLHGDPNHQFISDINELPDGQLIVGGTYGGVSLFNGQKIKDIPWVSQSQELQKVLPSGKETYFFTDRTILKTKILADTSLPVFEAKKPWGLVSQVVEIASRWLVVAADSGLMIYDATLPARSLFLPQSNDPLKRKFVGMQLTGPKELTLISHKGELATMDFSSGWAIFSSNQLPIPLSLEPNENLECAVFGVGKQVKWVATSRGRIIAPGDQTIDLRLMNEGISPSISCLLLDKNENLWIGTEGGGVLMKNKSMVLNFNNFPHLHTNYLKAIFQSGDGNIMAGGTKTGLIVLQKGKLGMEEKVYLPGHSIFSIAESNSAIFVGTEKGLMILHPEKFIVQQTFPTRAKVIVINPLLSGDVLVGTYGDGAYLLTANGQWKRVNEPGSHPQYVYGFEPESEGLFLIPSNSGLWRFHSHNKVMQKVPVPDTISNVFFAVTKDPYGTIWFSIADGLAGYRAGQWTKISTQQGISSLLIYTLNADAFGNLWVGTNAGLDRITVDRNGKLLSIKNFGPADGYEGYEANMRASFLTGNALLIGTIEGLFQVPVGKTNLDPLPPKPIITSVAIQQGNGKWTDAEWNNPTNWFPVPPVGSLIPGAEKGISFSFQAINPGLPQKLLYSFMLEGHTSSQWSEPGSDHRAIFGALKGKEFTFWVKTTYDGKSFSIPEKFSFSIDQPWYQEAPFVAFASLLILGIISLLFLGFYKNVKRDSLIKNPSVTPERLSQILLLLAALFHPISYFLSPLAEAGHFFARLVFIVNISAVLLFLLLTLISREFRRKSFLFLQITFVLFIASKAYSVFISALDPYFVVSYLFVSVLGYLVLSRFWEIILFGILQVGFSLICYGFIAHPLYHPLLFIASNLLVFILLMLTLLKKKKQDTRLEFSNTVVNTGPVLVLGFNNNGTLVFSSGNVFDLLGFHESEVNGKLWWTDVVQEDAEIEKLISRLSSSDNSPVQVRLKKKNGNHCLYKFSFRPLNEHITLLLGQDITEAQALENKFEHLVENAPDCIYQTDFYGKIVYANPQTAFLLGVSQKDLVGRMFYEFIREDKRQEVLDFYTRQFRENIASTYSEYPMVTTAGHIRWLGFQVVMLNRTAEQNIEGYIAIGRDITERLEAEQLIQHQHKNITDSLSYASRIKQALLPDEQALKEAFPEAACINQPKDIIGGDFFWMSRSGKKQIFVLGDCTGHGVPGAFMTTIAVGLLRQIIREDFSRSCEDVLSIFNKTLTKLLTTNGQNDRNDFVELAVCFIDEEQRRMHFISSGIGLHLLRNGQLASFHNGSRGLNFQVDYKGQAQIIEIQPNDTFYLFTDGLFDQIGGEKKKRFTRQRLLDLIQRQSPNGLDKGVATIRQELKAWQGDLPQIDDQLLVAFRL